MFSEDGIARVFNLTEAQSQAVTTRLQDLAVTAGAGSGKTLTLVARYLSLLAEGLSPRRIVAITFTEKAAREMRNRVRIQLVNLARKTQDPAGCDLWESLTAQMDSARIGTIHSLCAEMLRTNPAELGVDPRFEVLDEGQAAALKVQVVQDSLAWAVPRPEMAILFEGLTIRGLEELLAYLLNRRLDAVEILNSGANPSGWIDDTLGLALDRQEITGPLNGLRAMQAGEDLQSDAGGTLAAQIEELLLVWSEARAAQVAGNWLACAQNLYLARREKMSLRAGKKDSQAKSMLAELRDAYDEWLDPWLGGSKSGSPGPDPDLENTTRELTPLAGDLFRYAEDRYADALRQRQALDFDDLESGAVALLQIEAVRSAWQAEIDAVLVDEFQDTNRRQREIVTSLAGKPDQSGRLFIVGDARQSIYRFRGADVRVFRNLQDEITQTGGEVINLDLTFRAHAELLSVVEELLARIMGTDPEPEKPYKIPFSSLTAFHQEAPPSTTAPYLEFILGLGEDAAQGRLAAAQALANRLVGLKQQGRIVDWQDVCLLFRASTAFPIYEQAFENSGIPFVTVAGRGFFDRPEIRDLLNILQALADPWDDLALAGALRSPVFGLSDAALYCLRWAGEKPQSLWLALERSLDLLEPQERFLAARAWSILSELRLKVDRLQVAEVLKKLIDRTDLRAILAMADRQVKDNSRLWRNLDKLLEDATTSRLVNVRAFLEYLKTLKDAGAREGEAPVEAESAQGGAVRLMTVHKAKGLEFKWVVIADAGRSPRGAVDPAFLLPETGLAIRLDNLEGESLVYRLARWLDNQQAEAEEQRLLYVAATRAKDQLIVNGHLSTGNQKLRASGWLGELLAAAGIEVESLDTAGEARVVTTPAGRNVGLQVVQTVDVGEQPALENQFSDRVVGDELPLFRPVPTPQAPEGENETPDEPLRFSWRKDDRRPAPAAEIVGRLVHRALQRWLFPGDPALDRLMESLAAGNGLADPLQKKICLEKVFQLLKRLRDHPVWAEISTAQVRIHEVPYVRPIPGQGVEAGTIDLLYRDPGGWHLIEFKTEELSEEKELEDALRKHSQQLLRYRQASRAILGPLASARLCFLDYQEKVELFD